MSMQSKFKTLVADLDRDTLEELGRTVRSEIEGRRREEAIKLEQIHPRMSPEEKDRAAREIARVMRDGDDA